MQIKLNSLADVISGYGFRGAIEPDLNGNVFVVQARNIPAGELITTTDSLTKVLLQSISDTHYLQKKDVLIVSRGMKSGAFRAALFFADTKNVIASSSVHIIRLKNQDILPEYVMHYLNSDIGQTFLAEVISGSYIGALSRKELERIQIPVPALHEQKAVIDLCKNIAEQQRILERRKHINKNIPNLVFNNLITG